MSEVMLHGVLRMPPDLWDNDSPIDVSQRHSRYVEASNKIYAVTEEIERLNALVAMQHKALTALTEEFRTGAGGSRNFSMSMRKEIITNALSATDETVSAWQSKRDNEIVFRAFELAADNASDDASEKYCRFLAERLRDKGE